MSGADHNGAVGVSPGLLAAVRESHARLGVRLDAVDDVVVRRASRLPGWTVGHVLTHLARNADSFVRIIEGATDGRRVAQYPGGPEQRDGEIQTGAVRSSAAIVNDVRSSSERLARALESATQAAWDGAGVILDGTVIPCRQLPLRRMREVEFHHVDLDMGYEITDWPDEFVALSLSAELPRLTDRIAATAERARLLAWIAGRANEPGSVEFGSF